MKKCKADRLLKQEQRKGKLRRMNPGFGIFEIPFAPPFAPTVQALSDALADVCVHEALRGLTPEQKIVVAEVIRSFKPLVVKASEGKKGARGKKPQVSSLVQ